ncbi:MAG TPA: peptidylprolyl isomerase [Stellaceae bacterium]|jgi:peptidylprolyl isomerase|nr:peptidylprolyl isomerase [Stellaceae bacterium]
MRLRFPAVLLFVLLGLSGVARAADPQNTLYMDLAFGRVVIELRTDIAPNTCAQIKKLARAGFYDGTVFHRVIAGFMAQGGDPTGTGTGGSGHPLHAEFSPTEHFVRGTVGLARASDPNSGDSQFYIMFDAAPALDGKYTIFGKVVSGMEYVDKLKKGDPAQNGHVTNPDKIIKMQVAADVIAAEQKANQPKPKEPADPTLGEAPNLHK